MYTKMLEIRRFEEKIGEEYGKGLVPGLVHLSIGQEGVAVGVCANLKDDDYAIGTHRGHGIAIAKGVPLDKLAAEILGKESGCCKGRGGSMRVAYINKGLLYSCPIVGTGLPLAVGVGLSIKLRRTNQVAVSFFGDGASNTGDFHEALNLAAIWKLPVIFVCENNMYAISVHIKKSTSVENISERARGYNIPGITVDGNDVIAIYNAAREAIQRARNGGGPTLIECKTYRTVGHGTTDPGVAYRSIEEIDEWKKKCPINRLRSYLIANRILSEESLQRIEGEVEARVKEAIKFAEESPYPSPDQVAEYVY
ncbi:thiamine pyrophosphate-dependent dehydrogenase E1 component subunit alpha [Candidatus Bathyarchaeota archaeon]|nr:thiamine pyrophosphate-dependent dehydrogenase E1 component subunit alpha [Candidatus Bathyarchaeota archaeon]